MLFDSLHNKVLKLADDVSIVIERIRELLRVRPVAVSEAWVIGRTGSDSLMEKNASLNSAHENSSKPVLTVTLVCCQSHIVRTTRNCALPLIIRA
jgi:hypothetical protein